jgi:hypothetical protein
MASNATKYISVFIKKVLCGFYGVFTNIWWVKVLMSPIEEIIWFRDASNTNAASSENQVL